MTLDATGNVKTINYSLFFYTALYLSTQALYATFLLCTSSPAFGMPPRIAWH